jgi:uncharacterized protein
MFLTDPAAMADADLDELSALLELRAVPFQGMSLEMLDGFLCALAVGPDPVPVDEWTPLVWGGRPPRWESPRETARVHWLLTALADDVARRVAIDPKDAIYRDTPLIALPDMGAEDAGEAAGDAGVEWANGFLAGVDLRNDGWNAWAGAEQWIDESLWCIEAIAVGEWPAEEGQASTGALSADERLELIAGLPHMLHDLNKHRFDGLVSRTPIRKAAVPGRNDPCPCGSGRKFKKCCGAAAT